VDRLLDRTIGFEELNSAFDRLQANTTVRQVLVPNGLN
jgi:Zn-dependent alcohol dehydrogenase